jgi:putative FmdB family regulatory protein
MILYEYRCRLCGLRAEDWRTFDTRDRATYCPDCERWSGRRVLSAPALRGETVSRS